MYKLFEFIHFHCIGLSEESIIFLNGINCNLLVLLVFLCKKCMKNRLEDILYKLKIGSKQKKCKNKENTTETMQIINSQKHNTLKKYKETKKQNNIKLKIAHQVIIEQSLMQMEMMRN